MVGYSGKIRGNTGKVVSGKGFDIPMDQSDSPELQIVVRSKSSTPPHSPTLEIFPDGKVRSRSFRLKFRYREKL